VIEIVNRTTGELLDTDSVPGLAEVAALHDQRLEQMSALLDELLERDSDGPSDSRGPVVWHQLNPYETTRTWQALADWVGWLRGRYPLANRVPLCWWRHPELVEELTALWLAWREAYIDKGAPLTGGADWHGRWLPEFLRRIGAGGWNLACEANHRPLVESLYDDRQVDDVAEFTHCIQPRRLDVEPAEQPERGPEMQQNLLETKVATGEATRLGELPDSPIVYDGEYWVPDGDRWVAVRSEETRAFLEDAQRRLDMANATVRESGQS
jgi:hypothetical protein